MTIMLNFFRKQKPLNWKSLSLEYLGDKLMDTCPCCGNRTRSVWGTVSDTNQIIAAYFVRWTPNHKDKGASFDLIVGLWGDDSSKMDRLAVSLDYRCCDGSFMVVNANDRDRKFDDLAAKSLAREEVVGHPIATRVYAIIDAIIMKDERVQEVQGCE